MNSCQLALPVPCKQRLVTRAGITRKQWDLVARVVLIAGLYTCGASLVTDIQKLRTETATERRLAESGKRLAVTSAAGVDVFGRPVYELLPDGTTRIAVFGLRRASVHADVELWSEVTALLLKEKGIHLIGYCDGTSCAEYVRQIGPLPFSVIAHGQAAAAQAMVNADEQGAFVLLDGHGRQMQQVAWRRPALHATEIVREVLRSCPVKWWNLNRVCS